MIVVLMSEIYENYQLTSHDITLTCQTLDNKNCQNLEYFTNKYSYILIIISVNTITVNTITVNIINVTSSTVNTTDTNYSTVTTNIPTTTVNESCVTTIIFKIIIVTKQDVIISM